MSPKPTKPSVPHTRFLDDDSPEAIEHGERATTAREEALIGTAGTHGAAPDTRAEEPYGELAPNADAEGRGT